jgi:hypothetical protein
MQMPGAERYRNAPVPDWDARCRNADAGDIDLDAHAQLRYVYIKNFPENNSS